MLNLVEGLLSPHFLPHQIIFPSAFGRNCIGKYVHAESFLDLLIISMKYHENVVRIVLEMSCKYISGKNKEGESCQLKGH